MTQKLVERLPSRSQASRRLMTEQTVAISFSSIPSAHHSCEMWKEKSHF